MTDLLIKDNKLFELSDIEKSEKDPSYTYETLNRLDHPKESLYFILGSDAAMNIKTWKNYEKLSDLTNFLIALRREDKSETLNINFPFDYGLIDGEIVRNYKPIPLEVALSNDISFTKGCYTGQEIIARMDARGALSRTLVTFSSTELLELGNHRVVGGGKLMVFDSLNNNGMSYNLGLIHPDIADEGVEFELDAIKCTILTKW